VPSAYGRLPLGALRVFEAVATHLNFTAAADALNVALDQPQRRAKAFHDYERRVGRVLDIYLRWASAWYTQEFVEVFLFPKEIFEIVPTVSAVLSGNEIRDFGMRWRLCIFHMLVALQKRTSKIAPKLTLTPRTT